MSIFYLNCIPSPHFVKGEYFFDGLILDGSVSGYIKFTLVNLPVFCVWGFCLVFKLEVKSNVPSCRSENMFVRD